MTIWWQYDDNGDDDDAGWASCFWQMTSLEDEEHVRHLRRCIFCCNIYENEKMMMTRGENWGDLPVIRLVGWMWGVLKIILNTWPLRWFCHKWHNNEKEKSAKNKHVKLVWTRLQAQPTLLAIMGWNQKFRSKYSKTNDQSVELDNEWRSNIFFLPILSSQLRWCSNAKF